MFVQLGYENTKIFVLVVLLAASSVVVLGSESGSFLEHPCGTVPISQFKILGGHNAPVASAPWMAMVMGEGGFHCGGTLITNRKLSTVRWSKILAIVFLGFVLTSAHCIANGEL